MWSGCDLSHNNNPVQFHEMADAGFSFVILKASQGAGFIDPAFHNLRERASSAGLKIAAYHFYDHNASAQDQAEHFLRTVGDLSGMLVPWLDMELDSNQRRGVNVTTYVNGCLQWLSAVKAQCGGQVPGIYSYPDFWGWLRFPRDFGRAGYHQWIARYGANNPGNLAGWSDWLVWQHTDQGSAGGASGVDLDYWHYDPADYIIP